MVVPLLGITANAKEINRFGLKFPCPDTREYATGHGPTMSTAACLQGRMLPEKGPPERLQTVRCWTKSQEG